MIFVEEREHEQKYQGNSYRNRTPQPQQKKKEDPKPVAKGKLQKPSIKQRLTDSFLAANGDDIKERVIFDWVIPGIKNIMEDIVHMLLFGDKSDPRISRSRGESRYGGVAYSKYYNERKQKDEYIPKQRTRDPIVTFPTRSEAEDVLTRLFDMVSDYGRVTVKDLFLLSDMPTDFAQSNYGWRSLTGSSVVQTRDGFILKLPKVEELR